MKKGTLCYTLEVCDSNLLRICLSNRDDLNPSAVTEVMTTIHSTRQTSRIKMSPLQGAVSLGHYDICKILLKEGADLCSESIIFHPLNLALKGGHVKIAHLLIEHGSDVTLASGEMLPLALALADEKCEVSIVKAIIDASFPVDGIVDLQRKITGLHMAVAKNNFAVVRYLLGQQANPNVKDCNGQTPLHYAVTFNLSDMLKLLSENGAVLNVESDNHFTPMIYSIASNHYDILKLLISLGDNIHYVNGSKLCPLLPLHYAANSCNFRAVQILLENGADVNFVVPATGEAPLHAASRAVTMNNQQKKISLDCIVELLIMNNADLRVKRNDGFTPLQVALTCKNLSVAKLMIVNGSELNNKVDNPKSFSTFHIAVRCLSSELTKLCLDYGADWSQSINEEYHPLQLAMLTSVTASIPFTKETFLKSKEKDIELLEIMKMFWRSGLPFDAPLEFPWKHSSTHFLNERSVLINKQVMLIEGVSRQQLAVVEKAVMQGAQVCWRSLRIPFPIHFIASRGNYEMLKCFLKNGGYANRLDKQGKSPLHLVAKAGFTNCCQLLLEYGACYNYCSAKCQQTPLKVAKANGKTEIINLLTNVDRYFKDVKIGIIRNLRPEMNICMSVMNCCDRQGRGLLECAVKQGSSELIEKLIKLRCMIEGEVNTRTNPTIINVHNSKHTVLV